MAKGTSKSKAAKSRSSSTGSKPAKSRSNPTKAAAKAKPPRSHKPAKAQRKQKPAKAQRKPKPAPQQARASAGKSRAKPAQHAPLPSIGAQRGAALVATVIKAIEAEGGVLSGCGIPDHPARGMATDALAKLRLPNGKPL